MMTAHTFTLNYQKPPQTDTNRYLKIKFSAFLPLPSFKFVRFFLTAFEAACQKSAHD